MNYENPELQSLMDQIEGQIQELESDPQSVKQKDEFKFCDIFYSELSRLLRAEPHLMSYDESCSIAKDTLSNFDISIPDNVISENDIESSAKHFAYIASRAIIIARSSGIPWLDLSVLDLNFNVS